MALTEIERTFYLKKDNRITGPFSMLKLKAMVSEGKLTGYDMFSQDKQVWSYAWELFPALRVPEAEEERVAFTADEQAGNEEAAPAEGTASADSEKIQEDIPVLGIKKESADDLPDDPAVLPWEEEVPVLRLKKRSSEVPPDRNGAIPLRPSKLETFHDQDAAVPLRHTSCRTLHDGAAAAVPAYARSGLSPFKLFCYETAAVIALIWNFRQSLRDSSARAPRFYLIASVIHFILGLIFSAVFGRCCAARFSFFFTPLLGAVLISTILGIVSLYAYLIVCHVVRSARQRSRDWQFLAAGIFMNYGTLTCTVLALAHGVMQHTWVAVLLFFIDSVLLCSSAMQLRDYAEENGKKWEYIVMSHVFLVNPLLVLLIYVFIKLM